jgi:hypothetical protein
VSQTELVVVAAIIGAAGSVVGGAIGGWITLLATRRQSERDRERSHVDRSHQAAMSIAESISTLEEAIVIWAAGQSDPGTLRIAFNVFARTAAVQGIAIVDAVLRQRVRTHVELTGTLSALADQRLTRGLVEPVWRHTDAVIEALEAHYADAPLPPYQKPPADDAAALLTWTPTPSDPPSRGTVPSPTPWPR